MKRIIRVFPRQTNATPNDELVRIGTTPGMFDEADEVHISVAFTWDLPWAEWAAKQWAAVAPVKMGGPAFNEPGGDFVPGMYMKHGYVITSRGCPNRCPWCVVPRKEGGIRPHADIGEFISDRKQAILLDNNVLASDFGLSQIEEIVRLGIRVDFNQGLDARIIAECPDIARLLARVKWIRHIRMAYDHATNEEPVMRAIENLKAAGVQPYRMWFYVLVKDVSDAMRRVEQLRAAGCEPFAQPYRDFEHNIKPTQFQRDFAHWVNKKELFNSIEFNDFEPRKGFKCSQYFL